MQKKRSLDIQAQIVDTGETRISVDGSDGKTIILGAAMILRAIAAPSGLPTKEVWEAVGSIVNAPNFDETADRFTRTEPKDD